MSRWILMCLVLTACLLNACAPGGEPPAVTETSEALPSAEAETRILRVAVFNIKELTRDKLDAVDAAGRGIDPQLLAAARVVRRARPDILLVNEIDTDSKGQNGELFVRRYLAIVGGGENGEPLGEPINYPYTYMAPVNTGKPSGVDLNRDGDATDPEDAYGFGRYPGQYGMAILSREPIDAPSARTFQTFLWRDMPGNLLPDGSDGKPAWYGTEQVAVLRLSSKSHWDVPIRVGGTTLHLLASHPTPPVFDGDEDRNGRRNHDEIRLWADYLSGGKAADYLVDDAGRRGGFEAGKSAIILGDLNADPFAGSHDPKRRSPIVQLLEHPRIQDAEPRSGGGAPERVEGHPQPATATAAWGRLDYVLPTRELEVVGAGVEWPADGEEGHADAMAASDHRLVWIDLRIAS